MGWKLTLSNGKWVVVVAKDEMEAWLKAVEIDEAFMDGELNIEKIDNYKEVFS